MTDYLKHIPHELKEAIRKQTLITFVGAGLSYEMKNTAGQQLEGWKNMVQQLLTHLASSHNVSHLIPLLALYDPIEVLNLIEKDKSLPKEKVYDFMKDFFDLDEEANDYSLHKDITNLTNKIITTNYDTAFEIAKPRLRRFKAYKGKNYELTKHKEAHTNLLFKLHGCVEESDSMVLFPSDYDALYDNENNKDAEHSLLVLRNILQNNTLLIVGAGMGDHQINTIFKELKRIQGDYAQKHFIITTENLDSSLDFLTPINIKDYEEISAMIQTLLKIKEDTIEKAEEQKVQELEKQLAEAHEKIKTLETRGTLSNKDTQEKKALKYFSQGLEYNLAGEHEKANEKYEIATDLKEDYHQAYYNWGTGLGTLAREKNGSEKENLFKLAFEKYQLAINYKKDDHQAYYNWGTGLGALAREKQGSEKEKLFKLAFEKYEVATDLKEDFHDAYYSWGTDLGELARDKQGSEKEKLFKLAFEKYQLATKHKIDKHQAYYNWGNDLGELAKEKTGSEKEKLFKLAFEKYQLATKHKIDFHETYNNWGNALGNLANEKTGTEKEKLFTLAFEKYQLTTKYKKDDHQAYYNWGAGLMDLAQEKEGNEKENLFKQAFEVLHKGVDYGSDTYNLACCYALTKQKEKALHFLAKSLKDGHPPIQHILEDDDWKAYREDSEFLAVIAKYEVS